MNKLSQSAPLFVPAVALVVGIVAGDRLGGCPWWWLSLAVVAAVALLSYRWPRLQSAAILLCMVALGGVRGSTARQAHDDVAWPEGSVNFSYEAVVVSEPVQKPKTVGMDIVIAQHGQRLKCYIAKDGRSQDVKIGDRLQLCSKIEGNGGWRQGSFDYRRYLEVHGFSGQTFVRASDWQLMEPSWQGLSLWQQMRLRFLCYRHTLLERYRQLGAEPEQYAVLAAMTLGDKSAMTKELREVYAISGASHVLALSGLHLGIIYMLLSLLVVGRRFRAATQVLIVLSIWAFALLVGLPASVVRSALMISTYALLSIAGRGRMSVNALSLAAFCILLVSPDSLFDVGFQLSFLAMLAILLLQPLLERLIRREWLFEHPVVRWLWGLTTVSVAAQVGVAPLIAYYFGRFSTWFLLTNFIAIPAATLILYLALTALLLPLAGTLLLWVIGWLNRALTFIAVSLPCASIEGLHPSAVQTAMVYVVLVCIYLIVVRYDKSV